MDINMAKYTFDPEIQKITKDIKKIKDRLNVKKNEWYNLRPIMGYFN